MTAFDHWFYGVTLLAFCLFIHAFGLITLSRIFLMKKSIILEKIDPICYCIFSLATFFASCLHTLQACVWALFYLQLNAFPDFFMAITYSLGAFTTFGSSTIDINSDFILLSQTQAMNGIMAFGLTTALIFHWC